jgi:hypothetical protein
LTVAPEPVPSTGGSSSGGSSTPATPATTVNTRDAEGPTLYKDSSNTIFVPFETFDAAGGITRGYRTFPAGVTYTPVSTPEELGDDFEVRSELWRATQAATGVVVGDLLTYYEVVNLSNTPPTATEAWYNRRTNAFLAAEPVSPERADAVSAAAPPVPVLYNVVGGATNLRGFQVGDRIQPENHPVSPLIVIGTATGNATSIRPPAPVLLDEQVYRLSSAMGEFPSFTVPAQGSQVTLGAGTVVGGATLDRTDLQTVGTLLFAASANGATVAGLYSVVSGTVAGGLVVQRVDNGTGIKLMQGYRGTNAQTLVAAGAAAGAMQFAVYTRLNALAGQAFWSIESWVGESVLVSAYQGFASTDAAVRSQSLTDALQSGARNIVLSPDLGALHGALPIGESLADLDGKDILNQPTLYLCGLGSSVGDRHAFAKVSRFAGYYPGVA